MSIQADPIDISLCFAFSHNNAQFLNLYFQYSQNLGNEKPSLKLIKFNLRVFFMQNDLLKIFEVNERTSKFAHL